MDPVLDGRQGSWCCVDGVDRRIVGGDGSWVEVEVEAGERIPGALLHRVGDRGRRVARLPLERTTDRRVQTLVGRWKGARVIVSSVSAGRALVELYDSPEVAARLGFAGDQYMGWTKGVRADEIEDVEIERSPWLW